MPYDDPAPEDPTMLVGVVLPGPADAAREMAWAFAEEFAALGHDEPHLMRLFADPFYAGAHAAYRSLGEETVRGIVHECVGVWGRRRVVSRDAPEEEAGGEQGVLLTIGRPAVAGGGRG